MSSADYLLQASDVPQGSPVPAVDSGCNVIPLVDGEQYFGALYKALTSLQQHPQPKQLPNGETQRSFVFISAWELDPFLNLPDPRLKQPDTLVDLLASLAEQEVDVWVLCGSTLCSLSSSGPQFSPGLHHLYGRY